VRDEAAAIGPCLEAVLAQSYPRDLVEVVVVDAGSQDGTVAVVESYRRRDGRVRLCHNPAGSIPAGLNVGIRAATGDVIARVDSRTVLAPDYLAQAVRLIAETGASNVGGAVRFVSTAYMARALGLVMQSPFGVGGAAARYGGGRDRWTDTVYLGVVPRRVFEAVGLYDEEILQDEDTELNYRIRERGGRVLLSDALRSAYTNPASVRRFVKKNFAFGYWKARVWQKHPALIAWRHLVPPAFVLGLAGGAVLAALVPVSRPVVGGAFGLYVAGAVGATLAVSRRAGWRHALPLPALFAAMHVAWGVGFLAGAARFLPRWFAPGTPPPALVARAAAREMAR
jgi:glycosyltransferase involved in cell wall biosynthesis